MRLFSGHVLSRGPLSPCVPLEGSDTVQGLRALERLRMAQAEAVQPAATTSHAPCVDTGRRHYQRYKGPYVEQLSLDDFQAPPKPWKAFAGADQGGGYSVPASMSVLLERLEENLVAYLPNYLRIALAILLLVMYLRPLALVGTAAVAASVYVNTKRALQRQARQQQQQQQAAARVRGAAAHAQAGGMEEADAQQLPATVLSTLATWVLVAYTRCFPMILLALLLSSGVVLLHAVSRQAPSENRHRGRRPLGYSFQELLGQKRPSHPEAEPTLVFKQMYWLCRSWGVQKRRQLLQWLRYYAQVLRDSMFRGLR